MIRAALAALLALSWLPSAGCSHDLSGVRGDDADALAGESDAGGGAAMRDAGPDAGDGDAASACEPCPELGGRLGGLLSSCCRGSDSLECGFTYAGLDGCAERFPAGKLDVNCPDLEREGVSLLGCCRPDSQCGLRTRDAALGCVARGDVPGVLGGPLPALSCDFVCERDADCAALPDGACVPVGPGAVDRRCVVRCRRDGDCSSGVCALGSDPELDRVLSYCQPEIGPGRDGDRCDSADDCAHGVCIRAASASEPSCSRLCATRGDCAGSQLCVESELPSPVSMEPQKFNICTR